MTVSLCIHLQCDNGACPIAVLVPTASSFVLQEDLQEGDKITPTLPETYKGWATRNGKHYCPWCKDRIK
jgi:hypothetical protein